jgi:hypothetical protein
MIGSPPRRPAPLGHGPTNVSIPVMETQQIVALLVAQRNRLDAAIHSLEGPVKRHGGPLAILNGSANAAAFILFPVLVLAQGGWTPLSLGRSRYSRRQTLGD